MSKTLARFSLAAAVLLLGAVPAFAVCGSPIAFNATGGGIFTPGVCSGSATGYCDIANSGAPNYTSVSNSLRGDFWDLGAGNPADGPGNDNGSWPAREGAPSQGYPYGSGWVGSYPTIAAYVGFVPAINSATTWAADARINNCIASTCMAMLLQDQFNGEGYFALLTDEANASGDFDFPSDALGGGTVTLVKTPKPAIIDSSRPSANELTLVVSAPSAGGLILDPNCPTTVRGYKVYSQSVGRDDPAPVDRDLGAPDAWQDVSGGEVPIDEDVQVTVNCTGDEDVYLSQSLVFDSGFELSLGSQNSLRGECGPNLAEPIRPRPVNPKGQQAIRPGRGTGRGR